ncbi:MAG: hypothetical protein ABIP07_01665 [Sphingomicrobium sp.]
MAAGLRLTASDRPGQAQPVPTRDIPEQPWGKLAIAVVATLLIGTAFLEWNARRIGLHAGDLDNSQTDWAAERARSAGAAVAIVGDSRILFDTDLDRFEALTGVRPIQLAIHGTSGLTLLQDAAANPDFKGLLIVGIAETMFFQPFDGYGGYVRKLAEFESPAKRASAQLDHFLQRRIAFLDSNYRLSVVAARLDPNLRRGVDGPYDDVWKMMEVGEHRETHLWPRIVTDPKVRTHARYAWKGFKEDFPYTPKLIATGLDKAVKAVETIRARGGEVVFVRPPSDIHLRVNEQAQLPKAKSWDALLRVTRAAGVHNDDLPPHLRRLIMPEWSHLNRACATVFTDAYVRRLTALTPRLTLTADAPPPLSRDDCVGPDDRPK